jgi:flavin-dependent dehydrogenase
VNNQSILNRRYDVVVVGARPAGAGTALLLARRGLRVLMVDRGMYGTDTLSTHALMRAGVVQLARWGVLPRIAAQRTPVITAATFTYGDDQVTVPVKPRDGISGLYAPRRFVLDSALVDAAEAAGVATAFETKVYDVIRDRHNRVCGIVARSDSGTTVNIFAGLIIGADGMRSSVAQLVRAPVTRAGTSSSANVYGYWSGVRQDEYRWYYSLGASAGVIPTNDGLACVFASVPTARFADTFGGDVGRGYFGVLARVAPDLLGAPQIRRLATRLRGFAGLPAHLRQPVGPGWALVGDAAYFKDPLTAHGITDALVEAEYLSAAIAESGDAALTRYGVDRDQRVSEIFRVTDSVASFQWSLDEVRALHKALAAAMTEEVVALAAFNRQALAS